MSARSLHADQMIHGEDTDDQGDASEEVDTRLPLTSRTGTT